MICRHLYTNLVLVINSAKSDKTVAKRNVSTLVEKQDQGKIFQYNLKPITTPL